MRLTEKHTILFVLILFIILGCKKSSSAPDNTDEEPQEVIIIPDTTFSVNSGSELNDEFWQNVQTALNDGHVMVRFAVGEYMLTSTITVENMGHDENLLMLQAERSGSVIFEGEIANLLDLRNCKNVRVRGFKFTGDATGYAMRVVNSQRISIETCYFQDLPAVGYGALGVHQSSTDDIVVKGSRFERVGYDSHAHMIYAAYGVNRLSIISNYFKDCSGSFVRFRGDLSDKGVVYNNDFISTGNYLTGINPVFIEIPVFNDVNPGDERMGTNFLVTKNTFSYGNMGNQSTRYAMVFHSSGFNPSDRNYLISVADAEKLTNGTPAEKQSVMQTQLGLNADKILFGGNANINVAHNVLYRAWNNYGSEGPWTGIADIESAIASPDEITTEEEAINFYK